MRSEPPPEHKRREHLGRKPHPVQTGLDVVISDTSLSPVKVLLTNNEVVLNLCLTIASEIDRHRTGLTELLDLFVVVACQSHGLSRERQR